MAARYLGGGGGGVDGGRSSSGVLGVGVQAGSHRGRCFGVLVLVARLVTRVSCHGDKRSGILVQVAVVPLGVLAGDGVLGVGVMAGSHGGRCSSARGSCSWRPGSWGSGDWRPGTLGSGDWASW